VTVETPEGPEQEIPVEQASAKEDTNHTELVQRQGTFTQFLFIFIFLTVLYQFWLCIKFIGFDWNHFHIFHGFNSFPAMFIGVDHD
jgi:hypothetical protein